MARWLEWLSVSYAKVENHARRDKRRWGSICLLFSKARWWYLYNTESSVKEQVRYNSSEQKGKERKKSKVCFASNRPTWWWREGMRWMRWKVEGNSVCEFWGAQMKVKPGRCSCREDGWEYMWVYDGTTIWRGAVSWWQIWWNAQVHSWWCRTSMTGVETNGKRDKGMQRKEKMRNDGDVSLWHAPGSCRDSLL